MCTKILEKLESSYFHNSEVADSTLVRNADTCLPDYTAPNSQKTAVVIFTRFSTKCRLPIELETVYISSVTIDQPWYIHVHTYIHTYLLAYLHIRTSTYITHIHTYTSIYYTHSQIRTYIYRYTYTHTGLTHTHTHTLDFIDGKL
jgi:hypothetical protein